MSIRTFKIALSAVLLVTGLAACANDMQTKSLPRGATLATPDPARAEVRQDYRMWPADVVQIEVFDVPTLARTVQLDAAGAIDLPLVGQVTASGRTPFELAQDLERRYGEKYLKNPQITVTVKQAHVQSITVDGAVQTPGIYQIDEKVSLIKAIAMAKGLDQLGNPKEVVVFRTVNNQRVAGVFNLNDIRAGKADDPPIFPNDTIVVASSNARRTLRDIVGVTPIVGMLPLLIP
jgi:polysaccharide export outer membrane protein